MSVLKFNLHIHGHHLRRYRHQLSLRPPEPPHLLLLASREKIVRALPPVVGPLRSSTKYVRSSKINAATSFSIDRNEEEEEIEDFEEYLAEDGEVYQKTLRLVECAMFAAVSALAFLLSNSLAIEVFPFSVFSFTVLFLISYRVRFLFFNY